MEVWGAKVLTTVLMLTISLMFGLLPVKLVAVVRGRQDGSECAWGESRSRAERVLSFLSCVAGGVFMGTSLLHLLPEVDEVARRVVTARGGDPHFPLAAFIAGCGLFFIMLVEHCVMQLQHHHGDVPYESLTGSASGGEDTPLTAATQPPGSATDTCGLAEEGGYGATKDLSASAKCKSQMEDSLLHRVLHEQIEKKGSTSNSPHVTVTESDGCVHVVHASHHHHHHSNVQQVQGLRSLVLLLALSLHSIFEGLALGLQTSAAQVWSLFAAVTLHKAIMAFTMGLQFAENLPKISRVLIFMIFFSFMAPMGVAIGTIVTELAAGEAGSTDVASLVLQGLATGTFIYVTFFEVLPKEVGQDHNVLKVMAVILGFGIIALVKLFMPDHD